MRALALLLGALAMCSVGSASTGSWKTYRHDGVSLRYPASWHATSKALTPVTQPAQLLAVASYPLPGSARGADGCQPKEALDRLPPTGAFIFGWDYGDLRLAGIRQRDFEPRPEHVALKGLAEYECLGRSYMIRFRDRGHFIQVHVAFGRRATAATRNVVLRVLDSLSVVSRP